MSLLQFWRFVSEATQAKRYFVSGMVQGVGFRYTAEGLAAGFAVAGYVRNLAGGGVELVAEGQESEVAAFLQALASRMAHGIRDCTTEDLPHGGLEGFHIRY